MNNNSNIKILAKNGKSFYFAGCFLPKQQLSAIADLYAFCRYVDDCADELNPIEAKLEISKIKAILHDPNINNSTQEKIKLLESKGIQRKHLLDLIHGAEWDALQKPILNEQQLDHYCYCVAGVVGLMMNPLMKITDPAAHEHAIALGKAMQITNICRDILEDALKLRVYLPENKIKEANLTLEQLQKNGPTPNQLKHLVYEYLMLAENLYKTGFQGLAYIPLRCRFVILLAGQLYRHIGLKIIRNDCDVLKGRFYLNWTEKILILFKILPLTLKPSFWLTRKQQAIEVSL
ncbi:MAG: phytoene/squalene synthase family protein [Pseudobdellovibrio sp.]